jgi:hypothetical protein
MIARISILFFVLCADVLIAVDGIDYEKQILPILKERCWECHQAPYEKNGRTYKPKAGLRMDGLAHLMFGSDEGEVLVPNHPSKSPIYTRVVLPSEDDDRMPPKGDPLPLNEQELIRQWIGQGADFGAWVGATDGLEKLVRKDAHVNQKIPDFVTFYQELEKGVPMVKDAVLEGIRARSGLFIRPIGRESTLLEVRVVTQHQEIRDENMDSLIDIKDQIAKLDLRNTSISNEACKTISKFENLIELNIRGCRIDDRGARELSALKKIKRINAGLTDIGSDGLVQLSKLSSLEDLNLWGCKALKMKTDASAENRPGLRVLY